MPILHVIDQAWRRVRTRVEGPVTVEQILGHLEAVLREDALSYSEVIDANEAGRPYLSPTEIWRAANAVEAMHFSGPLGPRAVIAKDDLIYGLTRIFTNLMTGHFPIEAFRNRETAEEWIAEQTGVMG